MESVGVIRANFDLMKPAKAVSSEVWKALRDCGFYAQREAKRNAPRSPTMAQRSKTLVRKKRTKQQSNPGGLERSISLEMAGNAAIIYIARNSEATNRKTGFNYAPRIHDEKGKTWFRRGAGTVAKGRRADEKFIQRAIWDNEKKFTAKIEKAMRNGLWAT